MRRLEVLVVALAACGVGCGSAPPREPAAEPAPIDIPPMPAHAAAPAASASPPATPPPEPAPEEPVERTPAAADRLFREGKQAIERGDWATAKKKLEASLRADPAVGTLLNLAEAEARLGDVSAARRHYQEAYDQSVAQGRNDRAHFAKARLDALPK